MNRKVLTATLLAALLLTGTLGFAQRICAPEVRTVGTVVEVAPNISVVAVECPTGLMDGKSIMEYNDYRALPSNRMVTMYARPYPPGTMSEVAFTIQRGWHNFDNNSGIDAFVEGPNGKQNIDLRRMGVGKFCGHADFAPGWNRVNAWVTTPFSSELASFSIWAGDLKDKPSQVSWMCPRCRVTTIQTSCPVCAPCQ